MSADWWQRTYYNYNKKEGRIILRVIENEFTFYTYEVWNDDGNCVFKYLITIWWIDRPLLGVMEESFKKANANWT